jgi:Flp pilus assembly protein TadD
VPGESLGWYLSAALARRANDPVRAASDIGRARQLAPNDPDILLLAGTIVGQAGNMNEAYALYRRVVEVAPDSEAGREAAASLATVREFEEDAPTAAPPGQTPAPAPHQAPAPAPAQSPR